MEENKISQEEELSAEMNESAPAPDVEEIVEIASDEPIGEETPAQVEAKEDTKKAKKAKKEKKSKAEMTEETEQTAPETTAEAPKEVVVKKNKGRALFCFVTLCAVALAVIAGTICFGVEKIRETPIVQIIMILPQLLAYSFVSFYAFPFVKGKKKGWVIAFAVMVALVGISLCVQLGVQIADLIPENNN